MCISIIFVFGSFKVNNVFASENYHYFTDEEYTQSDKLLLDNGIESTKYIKDFSKEVKNLANGQACPEITQVIPRQYMESTEQNAVFRYNGKEYGFYVVKTGSLFDVLLIDFIYDFDGEEHNNEYIIRISPILQQTFCYTDNDYIGGIVGYFENGRIEECTFSGEILIYVKDWESRTYQPYVAQIAAYKNGGSYGSNYSSGTVNVDNLNPDVTWKELLFVTKHFNQRGNVN